MVIIINIMEAKQETNTEQFNFDADISQVMNLIIIDHAISSTFKML